jgi:hypothetical protein
MLKYSHFLGEAEHGHTVLPLFGPADAEFEKVAAPTLLPEVVEYIAGLKPKNSSQYVLVNAMGAGEYYSSNINGDHFPEAALIHKPSDWSGNPLLDRVVSKDWPYGFPTFYNAFPYCFPAGTPIVMADRTRKPIEAVQAGDIVATESGPAAVGGVKCRDYLGEGVELRLRGDYIPLVSTADHPLLVYRREQLHCRHKYCRLTVQEGKRPHIEECVELRSPVGDPTWIRADEVLPGDYLVLCPPRHGCVEVEPHFAELVGWVASEGYLSKDGYLIQFTFSANNQPDLEKVSACLESNGAHVTTTPVPLHDMVVLTASRKELAAEVARYVAGVKAEKRILSGVLDWSREALLRLLGAYISGDGHVPSAGKNKGQLRIRSSSPQMLRILADIIRAVGVEATIQWDHQPTDMVSPTNNQVYRDNGSGCVAVAANWVEPLLKHTRKNFSFKPRKRCRKERLDGRVLVQVLEREDIELDERVYCLSVPGPEHYFANEVVVHNSHHRNKDPGRAFGEVELSAWNALMKRVELVCRVDEDKCYQYGGVPVWDKLQDGQFPDVSMGSKVPFDTCSICLDWDLYNQALETFDPKRHKHPGVAVLEFHRKLKSKGSEGIRGLSITRADYCQHALKMMNQILPDGRKVFVYNDFPRFFDISFVFIGADKIAKVMMYISRRVKPSAVVAEELGVSDSPREGVKTASIEDSVLKMAFGKLAKPKKAEMDKDVVPSQFAGKAVPLLTQSESDIPPQLLDRMSECPLCHSLSTTAGMGMLLRPREFQRILLNRMGQRQLASELEEEGTVFPRVDDTLSTPMGTEMFSSSLARMLLPLMASRSALSPAIERRVVIVASMSPKKEETPSSLPSELLHKIGAAYNGYRSGALELVTHTQQLTHQLRSRELTKLSSVNAADIFTPLAVQYLHHAYWDEVGQVDKTGQRPAWRGDSP